MKTLKFFVLISIIFMQYQNTYSYGIAISNPCVVREFPSPYFFPNETVSVDFRLDTFHITDSRFARCKIYVIQGNTQVLMYNEIVEAGVNLSTPVNPSNFPNFGFNEPVEIKIVATSSLFPNLPYSNSAYVIIYKEGISRKYGSVTTGTSQLINTGPGTFISGNDCKTIYTGNYFIKQYLKTFTLTGNFSDSMPVAESSYSLGFSGNLPNYQQRWGYKISQTPTEAVFITFTYKITNILGQDLGFIPCNPEEATIVYRYVSRPSINNITQFPAVFTPGNNTGLIYCNLRQGTEPVCYEWRDSNNIHNHELIYFGENCPYMMIRANISGNNSDRTEYFSVSVRAHNEYGYSDWKKQRVLFGNDPHGCPTLAAEFGDNILFENPVLITSPDDPGTDVTDQYITGNPLYENSDSVVFSITETAYDETRIDKIELLKISTDKAKEVSVTEDGKIIDYKIDEMKNTALLNFKENVTDLLRSDDNEILKIRADDKLEIEFPPDQREGYIILKMRTAGIKNNDAAVIYTSNNEKIRFKCRSNFSSICLKVKPDGFTGFKMEMLQDCEIDQIAVVTNGNENMSEKPELINAFNEKENIVKQLADKDKWYAYVSKDNPSKLIYKNNINPAKSSFYLIRITGGYKSDPEKLVNISGDQEMKYKFELSDNLPNPFNPVTKIKFQIPEAGIVKLNVYDLSGKKISSLINEFRAAGNYDVSFDGSLLASGVYFYSLQTRGHNSTKRMILIK